MNRNRIGRVPSLTIAVVLLALVGGVTLSARGNSPFEQVLAKLDEIIGVLTPSPVGEVTLATPLVTGATSEDANCALANIGTETVEGRHRIFGLAGVLISDTPLSAEPGDTSFVQVPGPGYFRCEFTFVGTTTSVRANLFVSDHQTGITSVSVDAR